VTDISDLFQGVTTIEFIDWSNVEIPAALALAGFTLFGHEPDGFKSYELATGTAEAAAEGQRMFELDGGGLLLSRALPKLPNRIDLVHTCRPPEEQPDIARSAVSAGARALWIEPGTGASAEARAITVAAGLMLVEGQSVVEAVSRFGITAQRL
jgi:hypothetical protein